MLHSVRFIGELFKIRLVSVKIMRQCILRCLSKPEDEDWLERLCVLLTTIGKELECPTPLPAGKLTKKKSSVEMVCY
jgi:translation initiation factor 4G